jgi:hypothetical protein
MVEVRWRQPKTPAATAMMGAQTKINNQLKAAAATKMETGMMTATMLRMNVKAKAAAAARHRRPARRWRPASRRQQQLGGSMELAAAARQQLGGESSILFFLC